MPRLYLLGLLLCIFYAKAQTQIYLRQLSARLIPPYGVYGQEKLQDILLLPDLTQASLDTRLRIEIHYNKRLLIRTSHAYNSVPITLFPGQPTIISGTELAPYLESRNLDFVDYGWTPRNTASPNSALNTEYKLSLYEVRPENTNLNDIVPNTVEQSAIIGQVKDQIIELISQIFTKQYQYAA